MTPPRPIPLRTTDDVPPRGGIRRRARVARWMGKGFWAVLDQGLFSGSNFLLNVLLARWLGLGDYGLFALAYSVLLFMGTAQTAFVIEPMLVHGPLRFGRRFDAYLAVLLRGHWRLMAAVTALPALVALVLMAGPSPAAGATLLACAAAAPFILLPWLLRRACYVDMQPRLAAQAGLIHLAAMLGGIVALRSLGALTPITAFALLAVASLASAWTLWRQLRGTPGRAVARTARVVPRAHWRYGRWGIGAILLGWVSTEAYALGLTVLHGFEATGELRAAMNLILPAKQTFVALGTVALPALIAARARGRLAPVMALAATLFVVAGSGYGILLAVFAEPLVGALYGASYGGIVPIVLLLAALPLLLAIVRVLNVTMHAFAFPQGVFTAAVPSATIALTGGVAAMATWGAWGAAVGMLAGAAATVVTLGFVAWRRARR